MAAGNADPEVQNLLAAVLLNDGELDRAERLLRQSLLVRPHQPDALVNLGTLLFHKNEIQAAKDILRQALELVLDDSMAHSQLGSAFFDEGNLEAAESEFKTSVSLSPAVSEHHFNLGSVLAARGELQKHCRASKFLLNWVSTRQNFGQAWESCTCRQVNPDRLFGNSDVQYSLHLRT